MSGPAGYRSSLARVASHNPASDDDLMELRREAWRQQSVIMLRPEDVRDDWTRQALVNEANRLFGPRSTAQP